MPAAPPVSFLVSRFPNPSETFIQAQVEGLLQRGADVEIFALAAGDPGVLGALRLKWENRVAVHYVPVPKTFAARAAIAPAALFRKAIWRTLNVARFGEDATSLRLLIAAARLPARAPQRRIWLAHYGRWGRFACALRELGLIAGPIATAFHGKDMSAYLRKRGGSAYASLFQRGDVFLPISEFWRSRLVQLGAPSDRTLVHRMGVDTTRFVERARAVSPGEPVRFIGVGRMVEKKGFDDALAAFAKMSVQRNANVATLTLIGDGPLRSALQRQAAELNLQNTVRFTGFLPHERVAHELAQAHVFVLSSRTARSGDMEGIPVALMEAMAQGMPVLATRHSGTAELVEHEVSGLLCDEGDREALAANMLAIAASDGRWPAMGAAGAAKVRAEFDLKVWNDRLLERLAGLYSQPVTTALERANTPR